MALAAAAICAPVLGQDATGSAARVAGLSRDQQLQEAARAQARGDVQAAIEIFSRILEETSLANDRRAVVLNDRAIAYARLNAFEKAFADFNASARLYPENAVLYNNRAAVLMKLGLTSEALKDLDRAVLLSPSYAAAYANRASAHAAQSQPLSALSDFREAVSRAPQEPQALIGRAMLYLDQNRPRAALRDLDRALTADAKNATCYALRARARLQLGDVPAAIEDLSRALAFAPGDADATMARGLAYLQAGEPAAALTDFAKVVELRPEDAAAYRERAHAHLLQEQFVEAEADLTRSLQIAPRAAETYAYRALLYKKMGKPDLGLREIQTAEQLSSGDPVVIWARAEIAEALGNEAVAIRSFRSALAARPSLTAARYGLTRLGVTDEASTPVSVQSDDSGWQVTRRDRKYVAGTAAIRRLEVPLEAIGEATPAIVSWESREVGRTSIGMLVYRQGTLREGETTAEVDRAVFIDTNAGVVLGDVPARIGDHRMSVEWGEETVKVTASDGLEETYGRAATPPPTAVAAVPSGDDRQRRRRESANERYGGYPTWVPWAGPSGDRGYNRRAGNRRRQPKTLFDLLTGSY